MGATVTMKTYCYYLFPVFSILLGICRSAATDLYKWGPATNDLQMSIALSDENTSITAGKDFYLLISFKNISSNQTVLIYKVNGTVYDSSYSFEIISPSGRDVSPDTKELKSGDSGQVITILPNQIASIRFDLGRLCTLNEIGTYKIVVKKKGLHPDSDRRVFTLVSNPLLVKVVSANKP